MRPVFRLLAVVLLLCSGIAGMAQDRKEFLKPSRTVVDRSGHARGLLDAAEQLGPDRVDSAFKLVEEALVWSINEGHAPLEARCYLVLGHLFARQGQCDLATGYFAQCVATHPDPVAPEVAQADLAEARCLVELKRYLEARTLLEQLKGRVLDGASSRLLPEVNTLIARILSEIGEIGRANELLLENMEVARRAGDKEAEISSSVQLGENLISTGKKGEGLARMDAAWAAADSIADPKVRYKSREKMAKALTEQGEYEKAITFRNAIAEEQVREGADRYEVLSNAMEKGSAELSLNDQSAALGTFNTVMSELDGPTLPADPRYLDLRMLALKNLSQTHLEVGNAQAAQRYLNEYIATMELADREKKRKLEANLGLFSSLNADVQRMRLLEKDQEINAKRIELLQAQGHLHAEQLFSRNAIIGSLVVAVLLLGIVLVYRARARRKEQLAARLIELRSLRAQMNPHFIFNALNAVNHYIALHDERRSNRYLTDLSGLMRKVLSYSELEFIELEDEVELLEQYLRLEHDRFQDKFTWTLTVDPALRNAGLRVPPMLVQPFIENAIWHGLRHKTTMGTLTVSITDAGTAIAFTITDDGIGRAKAAELKRATAGGKASKGIDNARNRIALVNELYRTRITLSIADGAPDGTGTRVHFELPKQLPDVR